jgi:poly-gamma-glutamate capsule biosynthesis protein CapA/YwtB (metallophosphatase superfamily)
LRWASSDWFKATAVVLTMTAACVVPLVLGAGCGSSPTGPADPAGAAGTTVAPTAAETTTSTTEAAPIEITIAATGDVLGAQSVRMTAWDATTGKYDFYPIFAPMTPYLQAADYTLVNLETRLADPSANGNYHGYKLMNSPVELGQALKRAGVDLCALANNHSLDEGFDGIVQTLDRLDTIGLAHVGCYRSAADKAARSPLIVDIKGIKVAFINYTDVNNGLYLAAQHKAYAVNFLGVEAAAAEAEAAREAGADLVVMIVHWGREDATKPRSAQVQIAEGADDYQGLLQRGVDVILGAHSHVVEPAAHITYQTELGPRETYVVYSMGNFLPDSEGWPKDNGLVIYVHVQKVGDKTTVTGLSYLPILTQRTSTAPRKIRILPVLPGVVPQTDTEIGAGTQARMDKVWNYYEAMYDKPQDNIVPFDPADL